jgi:hypothetical protein
MNHRHLTHEMYTAAALDDVVSRGGMQDWRDLRRALSDQPGLADKLERVCLAHTADPFAQRYHFWLEYVRSRIKAA